MEIEHKADKDVSDLVKRFPSPFGVMEIERGEPFKIDLDAGEFPSPFGVMEIEPEGTEENPADDEGFRPLSG